MDRGGVPRGSGATGDVQSQQYHDIIFADVVLLDFSHCASSNCVKHVAMLLKLLNPLPT